MSVSGVVVTTMLAFASPAPELQPPGTEDTCNGQPSLEFVAPSDGASLDSPITVEYIVRTACNCDTGGCYDGDLASPSLVANGQSYPLDGNPIQVALPAGQHELLLTGEADFHSESAMITITIVNGSESSGDGGGSGGGNCSLAATDERGASLLLLGLLLGLRRRSSARR